MRKPYGAMWIMVLLSAVLLSLPWLVPHCGFLALIGLVPLLSAERVASQNGVKHFWIWHYSCFVLWNAFTTFWVCNATVGGGIFAVLANALQMSLVFGLFRLSKKRLGGILPYLFPIALFSLVFYVLRNPDDPLAVRKTTIFLLSQFVLAGIIHLFSDVATEEKFFRSFVVGYRDHRGGGLFGACLSKPLVLLFDKTASVIILIALLLICIILIIGRAVFRDLFEYIKERRRLRAEAENATYDDNSPYVIPQETSSQVFTIEDIQEQNRKKRVTMVDAGPPGGPVDLSFYGEEPRRAEAPKQL